MHHQWRTKLNTSSMAYQVAIKLLLNTRSDKLIAFRSLPGHIAFTSIISTMWLQRWITFYLNVQW